MAATLSLSSETSSRRFHKRNFTCAKTVLSAIITSLQEQEKELTFLSYKYAFFPPCQKNSFSR